ncbi:hypothetical protein EV183_002533 [Coemansia sp. RSA 2336]|nr:hypothetical protein EV183_002533 [Coemansia sp. RSA 2336]
MKCRLFEHLALVWIFSTRAHAELSRRGLSQDDLKTLVGALLFKNGRQTTCEIALMDLKSGLLPANCLEFSNGLSLNQTTEYEVYVTSGTDGLFPKGYKLELEDIHVHPDYDPSSLAYNMAVIEFNKNTTSTYEAYIFQGGFYSSNSSLVRRSYDHDIEPTSEFRSVPQESSSSDSESLPLESSIERSSDDLLDDSSDSSGLSRSQVLAIAITVPLVVVCVAVAIGLFYYRRFKNKRSRNQDDDNDNWDPYAERLNIRELANEIRGIGDPIPPPTYNEVMRPSQNSLPEASAEPPEARPMVGALLFKNGRQTTCEIALMNMKSGLLSANCLDFNTDSTLNQTTEYNVYVTSGTDGLFPESYKLELEDIHVHPDYNQTSLEYNIAVIEFNKNTTSTYEAYVQMGHYDVSSSVLFASSSLNRSIKFVNSSGIFEMQQSGIDEYIYKEPAQVDYSGKTQIGGNIFAARDEFYDPLIEPTSEFLSESQETSSSNFESSLDSLLVDSSNSSGLTRSQILAIAITIPLVVVCVAVAIGLFYYRRFKNKRSRNQDDDNDNWDPYAERLNIRELANEIRGIGDPIPPPTYNEVMRPSQNSLPGTSAETHEAQSNNSIKKAQEVNKA